MAELFTNNAASTLAGAIAAADVSLSVQAGDGTKFPALSGADFFRCTMLKKSTLEKEIILVTARTVDAFTITRAQEGTTALDLDASDIIELRPTAAFFQSMLTDSDVQSNPHVSSVDTGTANNYVLTLSPAISSYGAHQRFSFVAANGCTGASVVNVNGVGNVAIKKNGGADDLESGDIVTGAVVVIEHDGSVFQLISASSKEPVFADKAQTFAEAITLSKTLYQKKGADIASANDCVLPADGNYNDITGTTTINGFTAGVQNEVRKFHFDGAVLLKHDTAPSAGFSKLWLPSGSDYTTEANDEIEFTFDNLHWRVTGASLAGRPLNAGTVEVGDIVIKPTTTVPDGYFECDGAAVSRTTYAVLFALLGTTYGVGDGSTTFNIPDYRGEFLRGYDHGAGNDPDAATRTDRGDGTTGDDVGTKQASELESHAHTDGDNVGITVESGTNQNAAAAFSQGNTGLTGGNETRPRNVTVMFCIKY